MTHTSFFPAHLQQQTARIATPGKSGLLLDKNEQSDDVPASMKQQVLSVLMEKDWNRYPQASLAAIEQNIACYCGLQPEQIAAGPGSASIITALLNYFGLNGYKIIINQPSYTLFSYHCTTHNIPFTPWLPDADFSFSQSSMPEPDERSLVVITSPNNPTGIPFDTVLLRQLLTRYPGTLFMVDGVYTEFAEEDHTPLVNEFDNLIVLRSFSKAFPVAGMRLGYACAGAAIAACIRKLMLSFAINHFTCAVAETLLFDEAFQQLGRRRIHAIMQERERLYRFIHLYFSPSLLQVFPSQGNFLFMVIKNDDAAALLKHTLQQAGISTLCTANPAGTGMALRVSIGNPGENDAFLEALMCLRQHPAFTSPVMAQDYVAQRA